jgi:DNA-binding response OmpR family regulator
MLDLQTRQALVGDCDVGLSPAEFATVRLLFACRGVPMSRESILASLPDPAGGLDPRLVDVYISRARAKLAAAGLEHAIQTVWGRGYMAVAADDDDDDADPGEPRSRNLGGLLALA